MDNVEITKSQETLLKITKIVETACVQDASTLLEEGFLLLAVSTCVYDDNENRFVYSLGFPKPIAELSQWARANF